MWRNGRKNFGFEPYFSGQFCFNPFIVVVDIIGLVVLLIKDEGGSVVFVQVLDLKHAGATLDLPIRCHDRKS